MTRKQFQMAGLVLLLGLYCFLYQGRRGLFEPDEGRYSAVALQMIKSGAWLYPHTHPDQPHWTKPPVTYWAIAGSILLFGKNEFAVRFPNAFSFFATVMVSFLLGRVFTPRRPWAVPLVFATFLFPAVMCNGATTDFPLTFWETTAIAFFAIGYWGKPAIPRVALFRLMWAAFGLAFLTKGPPGLLPLLSIVVFLNIKNISGKAPQMHWVSGIMILLLIGGSWYFLVIARDLTLLRYFLWDEIILRVFTGHHERHAHWYSFLYIYVPVLILGSLPWGYLTFKGLRRTIQNAKAGYSDEKAHSFTQSLFLLLWLIVPLGVFVISKSNLPLYVLPLFVPLAIITAREIEHLDICLGKYRYGILFWGVAIVVVRILMAAVPFKQDSSRLARELSRRIDRPVEEIIFVNTRPALGLQFYIGADIKQVTLEGPEAADRLGGTGYRLWFAEEKDTQLLQAALRAGNVPVREMGLVKGWKNYNVFASAAVFR